ncbi:MAG: nucleoside 2-deoxyribosyltransferase domain-containing protein [Methanobrevibacter woesei]|nr:nucleoside 2-deoxyribosyltransferase domain-containing protein [Methanobrevibacter woesei]
MKVFLGGTVNSNWRDYLIPKLKIDYFNPVVDNWDEEAQKKEEFEKKECDLLLFVITPKMEGCFAIAEVVDASNKSPKKTILTILNYDDGSTWSSKMKNSIQAVKRLVEMNNVNVFNDLEKTICFINNQCNN